MNPTREAGAAQRIACAAVGAWLAFAGIRSRRKLGYALAVVGADFIRRALSGHGFLHKARALHQKEIVDLASEQSFPASDPPAWNAR